MGRTRYVLRSRFPVRTLWLLASIAACLWPVAPAQAQGVTTATLRARVVDAGGAPIPDAALRLEHLETGVTLTVTSGPDGRVVLANVRPGGPYRLTVTRIGLSEVVREPLSLRSGQSLEVTVVMSPEAVALPELDVAIERDPVFDRSRMGISTVVDARLVEEIPNLSRSFLEFAALSPLVRSDDDGVSVAGANVRFNSIQVDGALNQDLFGLSPDGVAGGRANARIVPLEAIEQFEVLVAPFDVRHSGFTGGVLNAVTRSGTNEWEGSAYAFVRDEALVGALELQGVSQGPEDLDNLLAGFTMGGPLVRDRAHVFIAGELERQDAPADGFHVGSADPLLTGLLPDSVARFSDLIRGYGADPGLVASPTLENDVANLFARLDLNPAAGHQGMLRYSFSTADNDPGPNRLPGDAYELSSVGSRVSAESHSIVAQLLSAFGSGVSNELFANVQFLTDREQAMADFPRVEVRAEGVTDGVFVSRRLRAGADLLAQRNELDQRIVQVSDNLTLSAGAHQVLVGGSVTHLDFDRRFLPQSLGSYEFASLDDLARNRPERYTVTLPLLADGDRADFSVLEWSAYAQDEWRVTDWLNLRFGVRIDVPVIRDSPRANPLVTSELGIDTGELPSGNALFSPRAAFNASFGDHYRTQIRGGLGLFTGRPPYAFLANAFLNSGLESFALECTGDQAPGFDPTAPPPTACLDGSGAPADGSGSVINFFDPDFEFPQDLRMTLSVDQELPAGFVASVSWLYTEAVNQMFLEDRNLGPRIEGAIPEGFGYPDGFGYRVRDVWGTPVLHPDEFETNRPSGAFPQVVGVTNRDDNFQYSIAVELRNRLSPHVSLLAGYAFTRSGDIQSLTSLDAITNLGSNPIEGDPNNPQRQVSLFDRPHKFVANLSLRFLERYGGTTLDLLYVGQSGVPYSYVYAGDVNADGLPGPGRARDLFNDLVYTPELLSDFPGSPISAVLYERLVNLEPCLQAAVLTVLPRNTCRTGWSNELDLRLSQRLNLGAADVRIDFDLLNVLNAINGDWGLVETVNSAVQALRVDRLQRFDLANQPILGPLAAFYSGPLERSEGGGLSPVLPTLPRVGASQWQAQLGVRVAFGAARRPARDER